MRQPSVMSRPVSILGVNSCPSGPCQDGSSARTDLDTSSSGPVVTRPPRRGRAGARPAHTAVR
jgi:hypothetical protein